MSKHVRKKNKGWYKTFEFRSHWNGTITVDVVTSKDYGRKHWHPSEYTYERFVRLANTGWFFLEIAPSSDGFGWNMSRMATDPYRPAKPVTEPEPELAPQGDVVRGVA